MTDHPARLLDVPLRARAAGSLWLPRTRTLVVADLHLGKAERTARRGGALLPPYETAETLARLGREIAALDPATVVCLGDSFDDRAAAGALDDAARAALAAMADGRRWIWVAGNHDPGPVDLPGAHLREVALDGLILRHEADPAETGAELSGHFHPKARLPGPGGRRAHPCFVIGATRAILPAFGAYTGGLDARAPALRALAPEGIAVLTGRRARPVPLSALDRPGPRAPAFARAAG